MSAFLLSLLSTEAVAASPVIRERARLAPTPERRYRASRGVAGGGLVLVGLGPAMGLFGLANDQPGMAVFGGGLSLAGQTMTILGSFASRRALSGLGLHVGAGWGTVALVSLVAAIPASMLGPIGPAALTGVSVVSSCVFYAQLGHAHHAAFLEEARVDRGSWTVAPAFATTAGQVRPGLALYATI